MSHKSISVLACVLFFSFATQAFSQYEKEKPELSAKEQQTCFKNTNKAILAINSGSGKTTCISSEINDPTDPLATVGIYFTATNQPDSFIIKSSNATVIHDANVIMQHIGGDDYVLKANPVSTGYADISIQAYNGKESDKYTLKCTVSKSELIKEKTIFPLQMSDASAVVAVDSNYMFVADDETNILRLYNRYQSGLAVNSIDISSKAAGIGDEEFDIEGGSLSSIKYNNGKRAYWIGSLGNGKTGKAKPYRNRLIATDIIGDGANATLEVKSYSKQIRKALIQWGDENTWDFTYSSYLIPKRLDGFNIEGLSITNEGESAFIGFRAPCVPLKGTAPTKANRQYAVMAPVSNFEQMMNEDGQVKTQPIIGEPILFDFGGQGIRDIIRVEGKGYVILTGLYKGGGVPNLYFWDGKVPGNSGMHPISTATSSLVKLPFDLSPLVQNAASGDGEGFPEAVLCSAQGDLLNIQLLCDDGTVDFYDDNTEAKSLFQPEYRKFQLANYQCKMPLK